MPAQGRWTPATGGRSSSLSIIGSLPAGGAAIGRAFGSAEQWPPAEVGQTSSTAETRSRRLAARSGAVAPVVRVSATVLTRPVRATPRTNVIAGLCHARSAYCCASSPSRDTRRTDSSWVCGMVHPANQPVVVSKPWVAASTSRENSTVCTAASWGLPCWRRDVKLRTSAVVAFGSAYIRRWQGSVLCCAGSVPVTRQVRPGTARETWPLVSRDAVVTVDATVVGESEGLARGRS